MELSQLSPIDMLLAKMIGYKSKIKSNMSQNLILSSVKNIILPIDFQTKPQVIKELQVSIGLNNRLIPIASF
jgi:hypothetical protein